MKNFVPIGLTPDPLSQAKFNPARFNQAIAGFDALNKQDPNHEIVDGQVYAK